jgi:hypothetical protein
MRHRWIFKKVNGQQLEPVKLSDHLQNRNINGYEWRKIEQSDCTIDYACYFDNKIIGSIPISWPENEIEKTHFWEDKYKLGQKSLRDIMRSFMETYQESRKMSSVQEP